MAWIDGDRSLIANRSFADGSSGEVWKIDVATGKATKLLGKKDVLYSASDATRDGSAVALTTERGNAPAARGRVHPCYRGNPYAEADPVGTEQRRDQP